MTLVRWRPRRLWDPFAAFSDLHREFANFLAPTTRAESEIGEWVPPVDVYSDEDKVVVEAELPGMKETEVDVSLDGGVLTIKGERKHEAEFDEKGYHIVERACGSFHRTIRIPAELDAAKVNAELKDGVLRVTLPKAEQTKARKIKIQSE